MSAVRGEASDQHEAFCRVGLEDDIPEDHPLRTIQVGAETALKRLSPVFVEMSGQAAIRPERLLKARICSLTGNA